MGAAAWDDCRKRYRGLRRGRSLLFSTLQGWRQTVSYNPKLIASWAAVILLLLYLLSGGHRSRQALTLSCSCYSTCNGFARVPLPVHGTYLLCHFLLNAVLPCHIQCQVQCVFCGARHNQAERLKTMMLQASRRNFLGLSWGAGSAQACARRSAPEQDPERRGKHSGREGGRVESGSI